MSVVQSDETGGRLLGLALIALTATGCVNGRTVVPVRMQPAALAMPSAVDLSSHEQQHVTIKLPKFVAVMDPVLVTARRNSALDKIGFSQRRKYGSGYFLGPERLGLMHPFYVTDVLRMVPGLRVVRNQNGEETVVSTRDIRVGCVDYYVDDVPFTEVEPGEINHINGGEVVAVEVYQSGMAPAQYARNGGSCTTIVLWTRFKTGS